MPHDTDELERQLVRDLDQTADRLSDDEFSTELYRALANNRWRKQGGPEGALVLSWTRAERLVNQLRSGRGEELQLAQTGGEGGISHAVADELGRLGWTAQPLDTSSDDPAHAGEGSASPPPRGTGEAQSPVDDSHRWEREGHAEAEASRRGQPDAPGRGTQAGGDERVQSGKS